MGYADVGTRVWVRGSDGAAGEGHELLERRRARGNGDRGPERAGRPHLADRLAGEGKHLGHDGLGRGEPLPGRGGDVPRVDGAVERQVPRREVAPSASIAPTNVATGSSPVRSVPSGGAAGGPSPRNCAAKKPPPPIMWLNTPRTVNSVQGDGASS